MSKKSDAEQERTKAVAQMREWLKPGDTAYTIVEHVSRSGMSREIRTVLLKPAEGNGHIVDLHPNYFIAKVLGCRQGKHDGCIVGGCGMDMGFHLIYNLSFSLYPEGFGCVGKDCPSNDHSNGDKDYTPHGNNMTPHLREVLIGKDHWHRDGGYAIKQRWL